jgi:Dolichyl-phosphate-mannose-protein mannosyltransferase
VSRLATVVRVLRRAAWRGDRRGWGTAALLVVLVAHAIRYLAANRAGALYGDGMYSWLYARSLAFDGDLDFTNDYALCGDPFVVGVDTGAGRPVNPFYAGPGLVLTPVLWVVRHVVHLPPDASEPWRAGCSGPFVFTSGLLSIVAVTATVAIAYRCARRWFGEGAAALAVLVMGLASPLAVTGTVAWYYSHLWAALAVAIALLTSLRAAEEPTRAERWLACGLACGLATLMRPQEALWLLVPAATIAWSARRVGLRASMLRTVLLAVGFVALASVQLAIYRKLYGTPFVIPQGKLYLQLGHAHPWLTLFGARSGLLYWTPLVWLGVLGIPAFVKREPSRVIAATIVLVACAQHYVASSALTWAGGATLGARVQTSLVPALVLTAAAFLEVLLRWAKRRRLGPAAVVLAVLGPWVVIGWSTPVSGVKNDRPVPAPELYGAATNHVFKTLYPEIGNPFTWPATGIFTLRYGAPPAVFDSLAAEGMFEGSYRSTPEHSNETLRFAHPPSAFWSPGLDPLRSASGPRSARFLVTLYWPWITSVRVRGKPVGAPATLRIECRGFFLRRAVGEATFSRTESVSIAVPAGAFDSGINEVLLTSDAPIELESWQWIDDGEHDRSVKLFDR